MRWFENHRIEWIKETVEIFGFINREHVMRKFGVSTAQAALDFRETMKRYPNLIEYNKHIKRYELIASGE